MKFIISHPAATCIIPASSDLEHLETNMTAGTGKISGYSNKELNDNYFNSLKPADFGVEQNLQSTLHKTKLTICQDG
jgi:hypothetical protein